MTVDPLMLAVAEECRVPVRCIVGPERWEEYNRPRRIYIYAARQLFGDSYEDISMALHRANHSTSQKAYRRIVRKREQHEPMLSRVMQRFLNGQTA
jgi:chromosomal replication initiation ATPase DnaA